MEPNDRIVQCAVTVQRVAPDNPLVPWIISGTIVAVVLVVALAIVLYHWADVRDSERDKEIATLRRVVKASGLTGTL